MSNVATIENKSADLTPSKYAGVSNIELDSLLANALITSSLSVNKASYQSNLSELMFEAQSRNLI